MESKQFKEIKGGVVAPMGFQCNGVSCGVKNPDSKRLDLGLIVSDVPAVAAATFTSNKFKAAPVRVSKAHLVSNGSIRAIVTNSGNANACTGPRGINDAKRMTSVTAEALGVKPHHVLVCSTGIIGIPMPIDRIEAKIPKMVSGLQSTSGDNFAKSIMTSDTLMKNFAIEVPLGTKTVRIGAAAKGAGMIRPNMATMLCFITTDAAIGKAELRMMTQSAVEQSFNRISIDGDTSTNDTVIVLANGAAGNRKIQGGTPSARKFRQALDYVMLHMAKLLVSDGERVTKFVEIQVRGATSFTDAKKVAEAVANSMLVKCSWNGSDPNWGRVMHAVGYSRARVREELVDVYFDGLCAAKSGLATETPIEKLKAAVAKREFTVTIDLNLGEAEHSVFTSDLSQEYVDYNRAEYAVRVS
jgi:glutamate N-acetyltransferase / amino-acid N-acetyltransferase